MITKNVKISTFCDTKIDIVPTKSFTVYSPIQGDINEPWRYAAGDLPDNMKIANIKCAGDCEKVHFFEQNGLTFFYLTYYCATYHEVCFELQPVEILCKSPKPNPRYLAFDKSDDGTIFCTIKLEKEVIESVGFFEPCKIDFCLPENPNAKYQIAINKISEGYYSLSIVNPNNFTINGLPGNFNDVFDIFENDTLTRILSFVPMEKSSEDSQTSESNKTELSSIITSVEKTLQSLEDCTKNAIEAVTKEFSSKLQKSSSELTLASAMEALKSSEADETSSTFSSSAEMESLQRLQDILFQNQYTDVILKSSNGIELKTYRCILAAYSSTFKTIFDFTEVLPVEIECIKFNAETILRALSFLYGKDGSLLDGDELNLLEFANEYNIEVLKSKCCKLLETKVNITNVCEYVKIAHDNNFHGLKQKCIQMIAEKKNAIPRESIAKIPHSILLDTFCS